MFAMKICCTLFFEVNQQVTSQRGYFTPKNNKLKRVFFNHSILFLFYRVHLMPFLATSTTSLINPLSDQLADFNCDKAKTFTVNSFSWLPLVHGVQCSTEV